jgi:hypothetical protein
VQETSEQRTVLITKLLCPCAKWSVQVNFVQTRLHMNFAAASCLSKKIHCAKGLENNMLIRSQASSHQAELSPCFTIAGTQQSRERGTEASDITSNSTRLPCTLSTRRHRELWYTMDGRRIVLQPALGHLETSTEIQPEA